MINNDPEFDPIIQIELVVEEARKNIDDTGLPNKSQLLLNSFNQIKEQLIAYIKDAREKLESNQSDEDLNYWKFAYGYYKEQLKFMNTEIDIVRYSTEEVITKLLSQLDGLKDLRKQYERIGSDVDKIKNKYQEHKDLRTKLMEESLDVIGRKKDS